MDEEEIREYATALIVDHAQDVEWLSVFECWEEFAGDDSEISEDDARKVHDLIGKAVVTVTWPEDEAR